MLDDYCWLTGAEAATFLDQAAQASHSPLALVKNLRKRLSVERARLIVEQVELRKRAAAKFFQAGRMYFERTALAQATDQWIARYKAARFPEGAPLGDLCTGIGGDLLELSAKGPAIGVDRDSVKAHLARANLHAARPGAEVEIREEDAAHVDVSQFAAWHIDPDRRNDGRRSTRIDLCSPGVEQLERLRHRNPHVAMKLAPAADPPPAWKEEAEWEWISRGGECRQLLAWFGTLARLPGRHCATVLAVDGTWSRTVSGPPDVETPISPVRRYLYEPDPAVIAARLVGSLAQAFDLARIAPGIAYLTSDRRMEDRAFSTFEVLEVAPLHLKRLSGIIHSLGVGRLEVKLRGVKLDPESLRRRLVGRGEADAVLFITRIGPRRLAIVGQRVSPGGGGVTTSNPEIAVGGSFPTP